MKKTHDKKKIAPVILLIIIGIIVGVNYLNSPSHTGELKLKGDVETTMISNISEVSGKIVQMPIALGQSVKKGDTIAIIDSTNQEYAIEQAELGLQKKQVALEKLNKGADGQQIRQAQNSVSIAQSNYNSVKNTYSTAKTTYEKLERDYQTTLQLYNDGGTSKTTVDNAQYAMENAKNAMESAAATTNASQKQIDTAGQQVSLLVDGARDEDVKSLLLEVSISESQLAQMREALEKYTIKAPCDGVIMSKNYNEGAMVAIGMDIASIASDTENFLVTYVAKEDLHLVQYNQEVTIKSGDEEYKAKVVYIDVKSRYTPKDLQTDSNKNKESMKVKMLLPKGSKLIPGEQAEVIIPIKS